MPLSLPRSLLHPSTLLLTFSGVSVLVFLGIQFSSVYRIHGRLQNSSDSKTQRQRTVVSDIFDTGDGPKRAKPAIQITLDLITSAIQRWRPPKPTVAMERPVGLLVTAELENVLATCKAKVEQISRECRMGNRKFRDIEFDLENDQLRCLYGLDAASSKIPKPADVRRVTEIYDNPTFFLGGPDAGDIKQGRLGDCWFLAALSMMSTSKGLVEKFCVARDESVGVYGFVFFHNESWVDVIVDDQLLWGLPKFESLTASEQELYNDDKSEYNRVARKGVKGLHFARSGTKGQTWVPLVEKAYAKLYGDYESMGGGYSGHAIEDFTGGVSFMYAVKDILDVDKFWNEELMQAGKTRLFGCFFSLKHNTGTSPRYVQGLVDTHLYSILRVTEYKGKRFVILRNPWGYWEWDGPWSDGSAEWTDEWMGLRKILDHRFGDDGQFVMEYSDFLKTWDFIEGATIFDSSWMMSSRWMMMPPQPLLYPWTFGDVIFNITLSSPSPAIIVLSRLDERSFSRLDGMSYWNLDFVVCKRGEIGYITTSDANARFYQRSVTCELELEAGEYVVYPRVDRWKYHPKGYFDQGLQGWDERKLSKVLIKRAKARSIASNFNQQLYKKLDPISLRKAIIMDLNTAEHIHDKKGCTTNIATTTSVIEGDISSIPHNSTLPTSHKPSSIYPSPIAAPSTRPNMVGTTCSGDEPSPSESKKEKPKKSCQDWNGTGEEEDEEALYLGLRVYTKNHVVVTIHGRLRSTV